MQLFSRLCYTMRGLSGGLAGISLVVHDLFRRPGSSCMFAENMEA